MQKTRLEAFSDGVIAIVITLMALELRAPQGTRWSALGPVLPVFLTYVLSYAFLGIYWANHHHMLQAADRIDGRILWANLHLLFWLSLVPFVTGWMGDNHLEPVPTATYGIVLLGAALAYTLLQAAIIARQGPRSRLRAMVGRDRKGKVSLVAYALAIPLAFLTCWAALAIFVAIALLWIVPDRRIEAFLDPPDAA